MASGKEYLDYILDGLEGLEGISSREMMGEYIIYYKGKVAGGIYDDRFLIKAVNAALEYLETVIYEIPYRGGKKMLLVDNVDDSDYLKGLFIRIYPELPDPKPKKKKTE